MSTILQSTLATLALVLLPSAALAAGGTIRGKVTAAPPKFLGDSVVYVTEAPGTFPKKTEEMDQKGMTFLPHVLAITVGATVEFLNHDSVAHNVFTPDMGGYNLGTFKTDEKASHTFDKAGAYTQLCSLHPEMLAYVYVTPNAYHAVVDAKTGEFTIADVPPGTYKVAIWNPKLKAPTVSVTVVEEKPATAAFALKR